VREKQHIPHACKITGKVIILHIRFEVSTAVTIKNNNATWQLKAGVGEREETAVISRRHDKHLSAAINAHTTI
jgi:hypothetical protein